MRRLFSFAFAAVIWSMLAGPSARASEQTAGGQRNAETPAIAEFAAAVGGYAQLHRAIDRGRPPLHAASEAHEVFASSNALASALQAARAQAREGDIFTAAVASQFRARIADALTVHGIRPEDLIASSLDQADETAPAAVVNGRFPWKRGTPMWPWVLNALPPLPEELQYRLIGPDLVLLDVHASLVVDILRNAVR